MKKLIIFFRDAHYGDLFTCKEYLRQIKQELSDKLEIEYYHDLHPKSMIDLDITQISSLPHQKIPKKNAYPVIDDILYLNVWLAQRVAFDDKVGLNHATLYRAWAIIFSKLNEILGTQLILKSIIDYVPVIDYSRFSNNEKLNQYIITNNYKRKILISNGEAYSGQSFNSDMQEIIFLLAKKHPGVEFICTKKFDKHVPNIRFTDDIISQEFDIEFDYHGRKSCDLNEISFLSTHCDIIIGKNSGPYIYCLTKDNLYNPNKTIVSLHRRVNDDMTIDIGRRCKYHHHRVWEERFDAAKILREIESVIQSRGIR